MQRQADYNRVAHFYDPLSRLVFGDTIVQSQKFLISNIPPNASLLIIGGGTGWILEEIAALHAKGLKITYVDQSERMICMSKKRRYGHNRADFICSPIQQVQLKEKYQVVITTFLFDNFSKQTLDLIFKKISPLLTESGQWLFADFEYQKDRMCSKILLKMMYSFFGLICRLETTCLPDTDKLFTSYNYEAVKMEQFYDGFIRSVVYRKQVAV